jgi:hypothetical protein
LDKLLVVLKDYVEQKGKIVIEQLPPNAIKVPAVRYLMETASFYI